MDEFDQFWIEQKIAYGHTVYQVFERTNNGVITRHFCYTYEDAIKSINALKARRNLSYDWFDRAAQKHSEEEAKKLAHEREVMAKLSAKIAEENALRLAAEKKVANDLALLFAEATIEDML